VVLLKVVGWVMWMAGVVKVAEVYLDIRKSLEDQVRGFAAPSSDKLLPDLRSHEAGIFTLVLDLNETLVHSDWKRDRGWRTFKRPGVEAFLEQLAQYYELVVYSDQLSFYVDPVLERLDQKGCIRARLSRDATQYVHGKHFRVCCFALVLLLSYKLFLCRY
jgi:import inner membrane translocase subunit TIM50